MSTRCEVEACDIYPRLHLMRHMGMIKDMHRVQCQEDRNSENCKVPAGSVFMTKDILCCPNCRSDLRVMDKPLCLVCANCEESFELRNGVWLMFRGADLSDVSFMEYKSYYERCAKHDLYILPIDVSQWACLSSLSKFIRRCQNDLILDIGSADGKLGELITGEVVCLDISETYLKAAQMKGLTAFAGRAEALPFKKVFDIVVLSNILEHVPDPVRVIEEIKKVLKPSGRLYIVVPYEEDISVYQRGSYPDPHMSSFDLSSTCLLLKDFEIVRQKFIIFTAFRPYRALVAKLKSWLPDLYTHLHDVKNHARDQGGGGKFPKWRHLLNHLPNSFVLPFFKPYSIMIEARYKKISE